jgi:uncharacterized protein (UPF0303 family)
MNNEINYKENNKQTTKELCEYFDIEDGLPLGTSYRKHKAHMFISIVIMVILVGLCLYSLIK